MYEFNASVDLYLIVYRDPMVMPPMETHYYYKKL